MSVFVCTFLHCYISFSTSLCQHVLRIMISELRSLFGRSILPLVLLFFYIITVAVNCIVIIIIIIIIIIICVSNIIVIIIIKLVLFICFYPYFNVIIVVSILPKVEPCTTCNLNELVPCSIGI